MQQFTGPLFIVGMPRSGTKLLRDLINQHPQVKIPEIESHVIPYFIKKFGDPPSFQNADNVNNFIEEFKKTSFYWNFKIKNITIDSEQLRRVASSKSWPEIFEYILRFYAPSSTEQNFIWGDKTPGYINHITLLSEVFPGAKFIHIIRDPRDYCLSVKKAWGKSIYRAAHRWNVTIHNIRKEVEKLKDQYLEVRYEDLLTNPKSTLTKICGFIGCDFNSSMLRLAKPAENLGDAKGSTEIVTVNMNKYLKAFNSSQIARIEEITFPVLKELNYPVTSKTLTHKSINKRLLKLLYIYDSFKTFTFHVKEKGLFTGISYTLNHKIRSSW